MNTNTFDIDLRSYSLIWSVRNVIIDIAYDQTDVTCTALKTCGFVEFVNEIEFERMYEAPHLYRL